MNFMIYNPSEEFHSKFKNLHLQNTEKFLDELVKESRINIEENVKTVKEYEYSKENLKKLKRKLFWLKFLRVVMCITIWLIPVVFLVLNPKIKDLKNEVELSDKKEDELLALAHDQTRSLNMLFNDNQALEIVEKTNILCTLNLF